MEEYRCNINEYQTKYGKICIYIVTQYTNRMAKHNAISLSYLVTKSQDREEEEESVTRKNIQ